MSLVVPICVAPMEEPVLRLKKKYYTMYKYIYCIYCIYIVVITVVVFLGVFPQVRAMFGHF